MQLKIPYGPVSLILAFFAILQLNAQSDSFFKKFKFEGDFRFRVEQDWDSRKSDGTFREDRSRLRYRVRTGLLYEHNNWASVGLRLRTGQINKQQDPQLTLGSGSAEFSTLPIGMEKAYFQGKWDRFLFWLGKNNFSFTKNNELFWSDNVFPEGVFLSTSFTLKNNTISLSAGHFIVRASNASFKKDSYVQIAQMKTSFFGNKLQMFPTIYSFKNMPDIPDGEETFFLDYLIVHYGLKIKIVERKNLIAKFDYYYNVSNYDELNIDEALRDEKQGVVFALEYGALKQKKDWFFGATYSVLERFAAVDYMAQNDWARWDYSAFNSPDGRLTNFRGIELVAGYMIQKNMSLKTKFYLVEQIVPYGIATETGTRIRFDLDIRI